MAGKCRVCTRDITGSKCSYCNYTNVEVLDNSGSKVEFARIANYKATLLTHITDFSINAYTYKWNSITSSLDTGRACIKIADAAECFDKIVWSEESFGQNLDENQKERSVTISYKFYGKEKELNVNLRAIKCNDFWRLGVIINQDLTVSFSLGTVDNCAVSGPFDLELK